jgi:hypothetical protein
MTIGTPAIKSGCCVGISCEENVQNEKQQENRQRAAAGFIINQFQIRDIQTQEIGGKRRA